MKVKIITCPACGANIEVKKELEFCYCTYKIRVIWSECLCYNKENQKDVWDRRCNNGKNRSNRCAELCYLD